MVDPFNPLIIEMFVIVCFLGLQSSSKSSSFPVRVENSVPIVPQNQSTQSLQIQPSMLTQVRVWKVQRLKEFLSFVLLFFLIYEFSIKRHSILVFFFFFNLFCSLVIFGWVWLWIYSGWCYDCFKKKSVVCDCLQPLPENFSAFRRATHLAREWECTHGQAERSAAALTDLFTFHCFICNSMLLCREWIQSLLRPFEWQLCILNGSNTEHRWRL